MIRIYLFFVFIVLLIPQAGQAQFPQVGEISLLVSPEAPGPDTKVTIRAESFSQDLRKTDITWQLDGKTQKRGFGEIVFNFTTGSVGTTKTLSATFVGENGNMVTKKLVFRPGLVQILWQADGSVPVFYKGKALAGNEARIQAFALPYFLDKGTRLLGSKLFYEWSEDFEPLPDESGIGRSQISLKGPNIFGEKRLGVKVSTLDNRIVAKTSILITPAEREVVIYEDDPLSGPNYAKAAGETIYLSEPEISLKGEVYFFSEKIKPKYVWSLNGRQIEGVVDNPSAITFRQEGGQGLARITLSVRDPINSFVSAAKSVFIEFGSISNFDR